MLVIIEGPDGAGKSTLIDNLKQSKRYFVVLRNSGPPRDLDDVHRFVNLLELTPPEMPVICDRHPCISDRLYGPILRNVDLLVDRPSTWMLSGVDLIVYCRPPTETILANVRRTRGTQLEGVEENCRKLIDAYDEQMRTLAAGGLPVLQYNYESEISRTLTWNTILPLL